MRPVYDRQPARTAVTFVIAGLLMAALCCIAMVMR